MIRQIKNNIPNLITSLNLLSGCLACIFVFCSQETIGVLHGYQVAFIFIGAAAVFDFCDGAFARLLKAYSPLGKELDSLADLISFGLAPGLLVFNMMNRFNDNNPISYLALAIVLFGALRLAKFNVDTRQTTTFIGLPIPANAIFWIGTCSWIYECGYPGNIAMSALIVVISILMVSRIRMFSLKFKDFKFSGNLMRYVVIIATILLIIFCKIPGLALAIIFYVLTSAVSSWAKQDAR